LDGVGLANNFTIYHQATPYPVINQNVITHLDGITLLGNLGFLMNTYVPAYGGNGPLWSLKFEWWFYMIYPAFWWLSRRSISLATVSMFVFFAASYSPSVWPLKLLRDVFSCMLAWWLGALLADIYSGRLKWRWDIVAASGLLAGALTMRYPGQLHDLGLGLCFSALLALGFFLEARRISLKWIERIKPLGDMSYTLYVTHFPILVLMSGWLMSHSANGTLPLHFRWVFCGMVVTSLVAYGLHFVVERPFLSQPPSPLKTEIHVG
jgi:peptidoglycan/LPS O-acetylase OafA/YrhL